MARNVTVIAANTAFVDQDRFTSRDYTMLQAIMREHPVLLDAGVSHARAADIVTKLAESADREAHAVPGDELSAQP